MDLHRFRAENGTKDLIERHLRIVVGGVEFPFYLFLPVLHDGMVPVDQPCQVQDRALPGGQLVTILQIDQGQQSDAVSVCGHVTELLAEIVLQVFVQAQHIIVQFNVTDHRL